MQAIEEKIMQATAYQYLEAWKRQFFGKPSKRGTKYGIEETKLVGKDTLLIKFTVEQQGKSLQNFSLYINKYGFASIPELPFLMKMKLMMFNFQFLLRGRKF